MKNLILTGEISSPDVISTINLLDKDLNILTKDLFYIIKTNIFEYSYEIIKVVTDEISDTLYYLKVNSDIFKCFPVSYNTKNIFSFITDNNLINVSDKSWIQKSPNLFKKGTDEVYSPIFINEIDPYYSSVVLFLPLSTNFNDNSPNPKTISVVGNTLISATQSKWGTGSAYFDGTGDYLNCGISNDFNLGGSVQPFTIECYVKFSNTTNGLICGIWESDYSLSYSLWCYSNGIGFSYSTSGRWQSLNDYYPFPASLNVWHHLAIVRLDDGSILLFINGVKNIVKSANNDIFYSSNKLAVGGSTGNQMFIGNIQDLRFTKGYARYTDNFTPPSRIIYENLKYSENLTQQIVLDNQLVTEWFNYSSGTISESESLNIGSGILLSAVLKKKNSTPVNCSYLITEKEYRLEIINDKFYLNDLQTDLILSEQFQLFSFWISLSVFKTWLNNSLVEEIDPYFSNVSLLLPLSTNFNDNSPNTKTINVVGNTLISATQSKWGTGSAYFDGSGDYLTIASNEDFNFGTGDFTIEGWVYPTGSGSSLINCQTLTNFFNFYHDSVTSCRLLINGSNFITNITTTQSWQHISIIRYNGIIKVFINGINIGTPTQSNYTESINVNTFGIGGNSGLHYFSGYLQDIRITKGIARYTENFTPPTKTFYYPKLLNFPEPDPYFSKVSLLLPLSTNFNDNSPNTKTINVVGNTLISATQSKWGTGSAYFDGSGDYLTIASNEDFNFGTGDFTIEGWVYPTLTTFGSICGVWTDGSNRSWEIYLGGSSYNQIWFYYSTDGSNYAFLSFPFTFVSEWMFLTVVRSGNDYSVYRNGILTLTINQSIILYSSTSSFIIGASSPFGGEYYKGYIQDLRITKGVARYSANFIPPSKPFWVPGDNSISKQFIGYESNFAIFNTTEPSLDTITYLLESSGIKGTNKIVGQFYINDILMSGKELILLDKNYYKLKTTISDINGDYIFPDLFYDTYYIASSEDNVQNIILGPIFPIPQ